MLFPPPGSGGRLCRKATLRSFQYLPLSRSPDWSNLSGILGRRRRVFTTEENLRNSLLELLQCSTHLHRQYDEGQARVLSRALAHCLPGLAVDPLLSTAAQQAARLDFYRLCIALELALRRASAYLDNDLHRADVVEHVREFRKFLYLTQRAFGWEQETGSSAIA